ncbi:MAG: polysaccharide biosynthesis/export family protein [Pseudomonadota bacterium]
MSSTGQDRRFPRGPRPTTAPRRRALRGGLFLGLALALAGCAIPRGAAIVTEVTRDADTADFVVYPVTRAFLPEAAGWPVTGERVGTWPRAGHGSRERIIRPGDTVTITIWDASESSLISTPGAPLTPLGAMRVSSGGTVFVPYAGNVRIAGNSPQAARAIVERAVEGFVPSAQVQLDMAEGAANSVSLVAGTTTPGRYPMPDNNFTVLDLIASAGGVAATLQNPKVKLHRGSDFYAISAATLYEEPALDVPLRAGDQVVVEEDRRFFLSLGASGTEQMHPFTKDVITAAEAMAMAGGVNDSRADPSGILILREYPAEAVREAGAGGPEAAQVVFSIDLTSADGLFSARQFRINSEDLIYVTEAPVTQTSTVLGIIGSGFGIIRAAGG